MNNDDPFTKNFLSWNFYSRNPGLIDNYGFRTTNFRKLFIPNEQVLELDQADAEGFQATFEDGNIKKTKMVL